MVEKPGAQNVTAYENQDNHYELGDHKKWKKVLLLFFF